MRFFVTGATGLVGRRLVIDRLERGDQVVVVSRDPRRAAALFAADINPNVTVVEGHPGAPGEWQQSLSGCDAAVHLAGAALADHRWTDEYKKIIVESRVDSTYQLGVAIREAPEPPRVLVCASTVAYYGDTDREVDESAPPGRGFLAELAVKWESQARRAGHEHTRVVILRLGTVLDERGGALGRKLPLFRACLGATPGTGRQYVSWLHWRDLVAMVGFLVAEPGASGPINATAPRPAPAKQLTRAIGRALHRPAFLRVPSPVLRLARGERAELLTMSSQVVPTRAQELGYRYLFPELEGALRSLVAPTTAIPTGSPVAEPGAEVGPKPAGEPARRGAVSAASAAPPAPIRLLSVGVDGTLLRSDGRISRGVVDACRAAAQAGCVIVLATARPPRGTHSIVRTLDLVSPVINYNGAAIWNPLDDRPQHHQPLEGSLVRTLVDEARGLHPGLLAGLEVLDRWYTDRIDRKLEREAGLVIEPDYVGPLDSCFDQPVTRLDLVGPSDQIEAVLTLLRERYWRRELIAIFRTSPHVVQVTHRLVDKGIALQRIAGRMGVDRDRVMAIGDAENDLGMLEWAGFGVAVANASPAVKELADQIVPSNDEHGVARAIQRYVLGNG